MIRDNSRDSNVGITNGLYSMDILLTSVASSVW